MWRPYATTIRSAAGTPWPTGRNVCTGTAHPRRGTRDMTSASGPGATTTNEEHREAKSGTDQCDPDPEGDPDRDQHKGEEHDTKRGLTKRGCPAADQTFRD